MEKKSDGDVKRQVDKAMDELATMRDEIRVRIHLASLEANDKWRHELEPTFERVQMQLREATGAAVEKVSDALRELVKAFRVFRDKLHA